MSIDTEKLRQAVEVSRARFGLTEMVLTCDEVEELCDEIDRLWIENMAAREATGTTVTFNGPSWMWGTVGIEGSGQLIFKGSLTIGPLPKWWEIRRWWKLLRQTTASYNKADKADAAITVKAPVDLTTGAGAEP